MRSMARWVLPVLVGPSTAVTPAPRVRLSRLAGEEKVMGIRGLFGLAARLLYHNATGKRSRLKL